MTGIEIYESLPIGVFLLIFIGCFYYALLTKFCQVPQRILRYFYDKKRLTFHPVGAIIATLYMRGCWNRQTGTFEVRVSNDVWVQVPFLAPIKGHSQMAVPFYSCKNALRFLFYCILLSKIPGFQPNRMLLSALFPILAKTGVLSPILWGTARWLCPFILARTL